MLILSFTVLGFAQGKKMVKKLKIKSVVETETEKGKTITDNKSVFNAAGLVVERINYNKEGVIKSIHRYKYNKDNDEIEEAIYDAANLLKEKKVQLYNALGEKQKKLPTMEIWPLLNVVYTHTMLLD